MKKFIFIPVLLFLLLFLGLENTFAQDFNLVTFNINSTNRGNNCHNVETNYPFSYSVSLPADETTTSGTTRTEKKYRIKLVNGNGLSVQSPRDALRHNGAFRVENLLDFGTNSSGSFNVRYREIWRESSIRLKIFASIEYTEDVFVNGVRDANQSFKRSRVLDRNFSFQLSPFLAAPSQIRVNGVASSTININPVRGCQTYTLDIPSVSGADRYRWVVTPASALVSNQASLTTRSIQVRPTFGIFSSFSVRLEAIQDCDGPRTKSVSLATTVSRPRITASRPVACYNNGETTLSIPTLGPGVTATWTYIGFDPAKVQTVSGSGTNRLRIRATGNYQHKITIGVTIQSSCGIGFAENIEIWLGRPTTPTVNPSGYPTVTINHQSFRNFLITNHNTDEGITGYNWRVSPNLLNTQPSGTFCKIWGNRVGTYSYHVTRSNGCGSSPSAGGAINVPSSGGGGGGIFGGPRNNNVSLFNSNAEIASVKTYPNPAKEIVNLEFLDQQGTTLNLQSVEAQLLDISGKLIMPITSNQLNIAHLSPGVYFIKINTGTEVLSQKLIKA